MGIKDVINEKAGSPHYIREEIKKDFLIGDTGKGLTNSWAVKNDGSQRFKDLVLIYLKTNYEGWGARFNDYPINKYYGICNEKSGFEGESKFSPNKEDYDWIFTLDQFENLITPLFNNKQSIKTMEKTIKMSLETAQKLYKQNNDIGGMAFLDTILLENFTKEELEGKEGFTWEDSYNGNSWMIHCERAEEVKNQTGVYARERFKTKKQALSALAFAQLTHIVAKYNSDKEFDKNSVWEITKAENKLYVSQCLACDSGLLFFYNEEDAEISLKVNNDLWRQYWMV